VINVLASNAYQNLTLSHIADAVDLNHKQIRQYYSDYGTVLFDVLNVISMSYLREMFSALPPLDETLPHKNKQWVFELLLIRLQAFFASELGRAFISIYRQFEIDARFERLLHAIKTEWYEMLQIELAQIGMKYKAYDAFNHCFICAYQVYNNHATDSACTVH